MTDQPTTAYTTIRPLPDGKTVHRTVEVVEGEVLVDLTAEGQVIGIETIGRDLPGALFDILRWVRAPAVQPTQPDPADTLMAALTADMFSPAVQQQINDLLDSDIRIGPELRQRLLAAAGRPLAERRAERNAKRLAAKAQPDPADDPYTTAAAEMTRDLHTFGRPVDAERLAATTASFAASEKFRAAVDAAVAHGERRARAELDAQLAADGFVAIRTDEWERMRHDLAECSALLANAEGDPGSLAMLYDTALAENLRLRAQVAKLVQTWTPFRTAGDDHDA